MDPNKANFVEEYIRLRPLPGYRIRWHLRFWFLFLLFHLSYFIPLLKKSSLQTSWLVSYSLYYIKFVPVYYLGAAFFERLKKRYFSLGLLVATVTFMLVSMHLLTVGLYFFLDRLYGLGQLSNSFQTIGSLYLKPLSARSLSDWLLFIYDLQEMQLLFLPLGLKMIFYGLSEQIEREKMQGQNLAQELNITRAQTAPHFMLNALNEIYAQVLPLSREVGRHLEALISVLHYTLYDTRKEMIDLQTEFDSILHFLELQQERFKGRFAVTIFRGGDILSTHKVPSLILFSLIENALKHAVYPTSLPSWLSIDLTVEKDFIVFEVCNSIPLKDVKKTNPSSGGIGLKNICKRLELIYQGKEKVFFGAQDDIFTARLQIPVSTRPK